MSRTSITGEKKGRVLRPRGQSLAVVYAQRLIFADPVFTMSVTNFVDGNPSTKKKKLREEASRVLVVVCSPLVFLGTLLQGTPLNRVGAPGPAAYPISIVELCRIMDMATELDALFREVGHMLVSDSLQ
jgi:hypothetical protein